jgi:hypothetical protein
VPWGYGWLPSWKQKINPEHIDYDALVALYEERQSLCVAAPRERNYICIFPALADSPPYIGKIIWQADVKSASKASWRSAHMEQVAEVMRLVRSPLAVAALDEDVERKTKRWVREEVGSSQDFTVRGYGQGLAGLFWRNFFGPPFVRLFRERLDSLPAECRKPLGEELVLVQPYELPTEAGTAQGDARERELITRLGPECFYDHQHHTLPTRLPVLDHLSEPLH